MNDLNNRISIVLPTYNGSQYLRQAIESCLKQTHTNIELIIVNDGSDDTTEEIIESYSDRRIIYLKHNTNLNLPNALNTGFRQATGKYFTWISDDNYYAPNALAKMLAYLCTYRKDFVYADFYKFDYQTPDCLTLVNMPNQQCLQQINSVGPCFLYSRQVWETTGLFDPEMFLSEDYDYWIRVAKNFTMEHLPEPLYFYRNHPKSLTTRKLQEIRIKGLLVRMKNRLITQAEAFQIFFNTIWRYQPLSKITWQLFWKICNYRPIYDKFK